MSTKSTERKERIRALLVQMPSEYLAKLARAHRVPASVGCLLNVL